MIRCCICDDRPEDLSLLLEYAGAFSRAHPDLPLRTETFSSAGALLEAVRQRGGFDLYLLDVLMPGLNGLELARRLREQGDWGEILFLTVSREFAVDAFQVRAAGYLLKPVQQESFDREVLRCARTLLPLDGPSLFLRTRDGVRRVRHREITLIESFDHHRMVCLADGASLQVTATLSSLWQQLQPTGLFFRPHRAYLVNLEYVSGFSCTELRLTDGRRVPISRKLYAGLKEAYLRFAFAPPPAGAAGAGEETP